MNRAQHIKVQRCPIPEGADQVEPRQLTLGMPGIAQHFVQRRQACLSVKGKAKVHTPYGIPHREEIGLLLEMLL